MSPTGPPKSPHRHGFAAGNSECDHELCRAHMRGYVRGLRARNVQRRNAIVIEAVKLLRPDEENGPVVARKA